VSLTRTLSTLVGVALATATFAAPAQAAQAPPPGFQPAIIDGREAQDAPWAARLFQQGKEACTASIIAPEWVLTAQHCVDGAGDSISFNIGSLNQHEGEKANAKPGGVHVHDTADLALVNIDHPVQTGYAPLGDKGVVQVGQTVQTYGWGATCTDQPEINCQSPVLKVADVKVTDVGCKDYRGGVAVCANRGDGIPAGGDSGGPMFAKGQDGKAYQVGVASTSDRAQTTAYGNVTEYRDWIKSLAGV
jgi:secreted trypsin-like serine protease